MDLEQIREVLPKAHWRFNRIFEEVGLATDGGRLPSEFWALDEDDQALLLAYHRVKATIEAYEMHRSSKKSDK